MFLSKMTLKPDEKILSVFAVASFVAAMALGMETATVGRAAGAIGCCTLLILIRRSRFAARGHGVIRATRGLLQVAFTLYGLLLIYQVAGAVTVTIHDRDLDAELIAADRWLFAGHSPSVWMLEHWEPSAIAVEILQTCYFLYYSIPLLIGLELWLRHREFENNDEVFRLFSFTMVFGFLLSCVGYLLVPAVGPRFTLHDFWSISNEMPGLWVTDFLRQQTNAGSLVEAWMSSEQAAHAVLRDAFPSGHTMMTLLAMTMAFRYRAKVRWPLVPIAAGLILATVYLRYHYVVDIIGGIVFAAIVLITAQPLMKRLGTRRISDLATAS